jgi:hypothetical protein
VHPDHVVPVLLGRIGEGSIAKDPGVAGEDVDLTKLVERRLSDPFAAFDGRYVIRIRHSPSTRLDDGVNDGLSRRLVRPRAVPWPPKIVDDHRSAFPCKQPGIGLAKSIACACDDGDLTVQ